MRLLVLAVLAIGGGVAGCSSTEAPRPFQTNGVSRAADGDDDDDDATDADEPRSRVPTDTSGTTPTPPARVPTSWRGHIDTSPMVDFGGGKWCNYHVVLSDIELTMSLDAAGHITASDVTNTMTESATACEAEPLGVQRNTFAFRAPANTPATLTVMQVGDPNNLPQADLTLVATPVDATHMKAQLLFHRTGAVDNVLNWRDAIDVELTLEDTSATNNQ